MSLKVYRIILFIILAITFSLNLYLLINSVIYVFSAKEVDPMDNIFSFICLLFLLAFVILQLVNTIHSIKKNTSYIKKLIYDDEDGKFNKIGITLVSLLLILKIGLLIYASLNYFGINVPYLNIELSQKNVIIGFLSTFALDYIGILLFMLVKKDDINKLKDEKK